MIKYLRNMVLVSLLTLCGSYIAYAQTPSATPPAETPTPTPSFTILVIPASTPPLIPTPTPFPTPDIEQLLKTTKSPAIVPPFTIIATPSSPNPGETISIEAQLPSSDKNTAAFTWTIDGKSRPDLSGLGKNSFTISAGALGSPMRISVQARQYNGEVLNTSHVIYITDLSLTWTTNTYIPKWYRGKALPVSGSLIRIAAIPSFILDGTTIPPERLIYTWNVSGTRALKGVGEQIFSFTAPDRSFNTPLITLKIDDTSKRIHKEARIGILNREPKVVIYQVLPLGGIEFRRGTTSFPPFSGGTIDLQAEPFFFNTPTNKDLSYTWTAEGITASSTPENPFLLTLDIKERREGFIPISVSISSNNIFISPAIRFLSIPLQQ